MNGLRKSLFSDVLMVAVIFLVCGTADARRGEPPRSESSRVAATTQVQLLKLEAVDRDALLAEDKARLEPGPMRFALPEDVSITPADHGTWEDLADGGRLWRLQIHAPNATDLSFGFLKYRLPPGATLHIVSGEYDYYQGPFTADDNKAHGEFWSPLVPGDRAVLELYVPATPQFEPELELGRIGRGYRDLFRRGDDAEKRGSCNINVVCPEGDDWRDQIRSVGRYTIDSQYLCTGSLVMDVPASMTPYFLSAAHCEVDGDNDQTVVVYWNHQSDSCATFVDPNLNDNQTGSIYRASHAASDVLLLELESQPDADFNVHYAGWDARDRTPASTTTIHHPRGDEKSISFDYDPPTITSYTGNLSPGDGTHFRIADWDVGTTEGGSSGACLFDNQTDVSGLSTVALRPAGTTTLTGTAASPGSGRVAALLLRASRAGSIPRAPAPCLSTAPTAPAAVVAAAARAAGTPTTITAPGRAPRGSEAAGRVTPTTCMG
jgi:lysyl endopeptidase